MRSGGVRSLALPAVCAVTAALLLTVTAGPHGQETFGSWFLVRMFSETGRVGSLGRSPLYVVYASLFLPLGYPWAVVVVRFIDAVLMFAGLYALALTVVPRWAALLAALVWLPTLFVEPSVQGLAVALLSAAMAVRRRHSGRLGRSVSYALLAAVPLIRLNYVVFMAGWAAWDLFWLHRASGLAGMMAVLRPRRSDAVMVLPVLLVGVFASLQSPDPWNNAWYGDMRWSGLSDSSLATAAQMGAMVQYQIIHRHSGDFGNHDIWAVIHDDFKGAGDLRALAAVEPDLVIGHAIGNLQIVALAQGLTALGSGVNGVLAGSALRWGGYALFWLLICWALAGRWRDGDRESAFYGLIAVGASLPLLVVPPTERYLLHFLPVFLAAAAWWGNRLPGAAGMAVVVVALGGGGPSWLSPIRALAGPEIRGRPTVVAEAMEGEFPRLQALLARCRGVMTSQESLQVAFGSLPRQQVLSVFEIPPFGRLGDGFYDGLRPDRVDCLVWTEAAVQASATQFTTLHSRYENYLAPYGAMLKEAGAREYAFAGGVRAVAPAASHGSASGTGNQ